MTPARQPVWRTLAEAGWRITAENWWYIADENQWYISVRDLTLATMMIGNLPVVQTNVPLYRDEACHYDAPVTVLSSEAGGLVEGRLLITSQRLMLLAASGGLSSAWAQCRAVESMDQSLVLATSTHNAMIMCSDPQYVATLIAAARRRYVPQAPSEPIRAGKRLA